MSVSLSKGSRVNLTKASSNSNLRRVRVGAGWDPAPALLNSIDCDAYVIIRSDGSSEQSVVNEHADSNKKKGLFSRFKKSSNAEPVVSNSNKATGEKTDIVSFHIKRWGNGLVQHNGDNLTGVGEGDDETIDINLQDMPDSVKELVCCINIYSAKSKGQEFSMIDNAFIRIVDVDTKEEICKFNLKRYGDYTAVIFGTLKKEDGDWVFEAIGKGLDISRLEETVRYLN